MEVVLGGQYLDGLEAWNLSGRTSSLYCVQKMWSWRDEEMCYRRYCCCALLEEAGSFHSLKSDVGFQQVRLTHLRMVVCLEKLLRITN
jgi:hypothetical protein